LDLSDREVTGTQRKLQEELRNVYFSQSIIRVMKWRMMRQAGHVAHVR